VGGTVELRAENVVNIYLIITDTLRNVSITLDLVIDEYFLTASRHIKCVTLERDSFFLFFNLCVTFFYLTFDTQLRTYARIKSQKYFTLGGRGLHDFTFRYFRLFAGTRLINEK